MKMYKNVKNLSLEFAAKHISTCGIKHSIKWNYVKNGEISLSYPGCGWGVVGNAFSIGSGSKSWPIIM